VKKTLNYLDIQSLKRAISGFEGEFQVADVLPNLPEELRDIPAREVGRALLCYRLVHTVFYDQKARAWIFTRNEEEMAKKA